MNLQPIVDKLQTESLGTPGVDLFREQMPHQVVKGMLVTQQMPVERNPYAPGYRKGSFQVIVRDAVYDDARTTANSVIDAITGDGITLGDMKFRFIRARHDPLLFPRSDGDLVEASVNFDFVYSLTGT